MIIRVGTKGSSTSGNRGHAGRPGKVGGSAPKGAGVADAGMLDMSDRAAAINRLRGLGKRNVDVTLIPTGQHIQISADNMAGWLENGAEGMENYAIAMPDILGLPKSTHQTVQAKYNDLEDMPSYQRYKQGEPALVNDFGKEDFYLKAILQDQGFNGKPDVRSKADIDAFVDNGEIQLFRGVSQPSSTFWRPGMPEPNAKEFTDQFRSGELFVGRGISGNGTYASAEQRDADGYADLNGAVMRMTLKKDAKVISDSDIYDLRSAARSKIDRDFDKITDAYKAGKMSKEDYIGALDARYQSFTKLDQSPMWNDPGRVAAVMGYDAIKVGGSGVYVILNRTALRVQDTDLKPYEGRTL